MKIFTRQGHERFTGKYEDRMPKQVVTESYYKETKALNRWGLAHSRLSDASLVKQTK